MIKNCFLVHLFMDAHKQSCSERSAEVGNIVGQYKVSTKINSTKELYRGFLKSPKQLFWGQVSEQLLWCLYEKGRKYIYPRSILHSKSGWFI